MRAPPPRPVDARLVGDDHDRGAAPGRRAASAAGPAPCEELVQRRSRRRRAPSASIAPPPPRQRPATGASMIDTATRRASHAVTSARRPQRPPKRRRRRAYSARASRSSSGAEVGPQHRREDELGVGDCQSRKFEMRRSPEVRMTQVGIGQLGRAGARAARRRRSRRPGCPRARSRARPRRSRPGRRSRSDPEVEPLGWPRCAPRAGSSAASRSSEQRSRRPTNRIRTPCAVQVLELVADRLGEQVDQVGDLVVGPRPVLGREGVDAERAHAELDRGLDGAPQRRACRRDGRPPTGSPRRRAQRPLPSMMIATVLATSGSRAPRTCAQRRTREDSTEAVIGGRPEPAQTSMISSSLCFRSRRSGGRARRSASATCSSARRTSSAPDVAVLLQLLHVVRACRGGRCARPRAPPPRAARRS